MDRQTRIEWWLERHNGAGSTAEVAALLGIAPGLVRWWASKNDVKKVGNSFIFVASDQVEALAQALLGDGESENDEEDAALSSDEEGSETDESESEDPDLDDESDPDLDGSEEEFDLEDSEEDE